ncbi:hypothetical protein ACQQ2N_05115 [Dokdonella sp. MW10]|uniref:hypothetical protein n=1 Tax=Dokdonella sp. MW10 TaxID=2992926 RepID=UPI003F7CE694
MRVLILARPESPPPHDADACAMLARGNEVFARAGVLLASGRLHAAATADEDGASAFWLVQVHTVADALAWSRRCHAHEAAHALEVRIVADERHDMPTRPSPACADTAHDRSATAATRAAPSGDPR